MSRIKNILINILLLAVFLIPQAIQNYHVVTVHHYVSHCDDSCSRLGKHFHKATERCPIHEYVFSISDNVIIYSFFEKQVKICEILVSEYQYQYKQKMVFGYSGRAPPQI